MARPYRPERPRGPKPTFFVKPKPEKKVFPAASARSAKEAEKANPYTDGKVRIYLDDERPCPPGWTLAKNVPEFIELLATTDLSAIAAISLDWYLGTGAVSGLDAATHLNEVLSDRIDEFTSLKIIACHSSDTAKARDMAMILKDTVEAERKDGNFIGLTLGNIAKGAAAW